MSISDIILNYIRSLDFETVGTQTIDDQPYEVLRVTFEVLQSTTEDGHHHQVLKLNGQVRRKIHYCQNKKDGIDVTYDQQGNKTREDVYQNGEWQTKVLYYAPDELEEKEPPVAREISERTSGLRYLLTCFRSDGSKWSTQEYSDGIASGEYWEWHKNGNVKAHGELEYTDYQDRKKGHWEKWHENGQLKSEATYNHRGLEIGRRQKWYENGQIRSDQMYNEEAKPVGVHRFWDEDGTIRSEDVYDDRGKQMQSRSWFADGQISSETHYRNGNLHGLDLSWFCDGQLHIQNHYSYGNADGEYIEWYKNGNLNRRGQRLGGRYVGEWQYYHENGQLKKSGSYEKHYGYAPGESSKKTGIWIEYDEEGNEIRKTKWSNGVQTETSISTKEEAIELLKKDIEHFDVIKADAYAKIITMLEGTK